MPTKTPGVSGTISTTEVDLFTPVISDSYHSVSIFLDTILAGDSFVFRSYIYDDTAAAYKLAYAETKSGVQDLPVLTFNPVANSHFKITAQKQSGTDRTFNFTRWV